MVEKLYKTILVEIQESKVLSGTVVVTVGSLINSFFSYLLQLFLGRNLTLSEFGTYNALLSLFSMLGVLSMVLSISIVKIVSELYSQKKFSLLGRLFWKISAALFSFGILIILILYLFKNQLAKYLNLDQPYLLVALGIYLAANLLLIIPSSYLKGFLKFNGLALINSLAGIVRLVMAALAIYFGYKVGGVYVSLSLSMLLIYFVGVKLVKRDFSKEGSAEINDYFKRMITFSLPLILTYFGMFTLNNQDLVLVKKFFDPVVAGYYAGVVILGKIILFGANSLTVVMFPQISILKNKGQDYFARFKAILWLMVLVLVCAMIVYNFVPQYIARTFFGERFLHSAIYLPRFSLFISLYVLINFIFIFLLAIDKVKITLISLPAILVQFILINFYHQSIFQVININISVAAGILVILIFYLYKLSKEPAR